LLQALVGPAILTRGNVGPAATAQPAFAEVAEIRITKQPGIIYLPLVVMEPNKLVEKHAKAAGLGELKVSWVTLTSGGAATDALLSGSSDLVTSGCRGGAERGQPAHRARPRRGGTYPSRCHREKYATQDIVDMIKAPNVVSSTTPQGTIIFADFMARTALIKTRPATWKGFFLSVVDHLPGNEALRTSHGTVCAVSSNA
jgi:hypothetical protein